MSMTLAPAAGAAQPGPGAANPLAALGAEEITHDGLTAEARDLDAAKPDAELKKLLERWVDMPNVAEDMDISEETLNALGVMVVRDYDLDENSRADWKQKYEQWLDFAMQVAQEKTYPWPQASNVIYPLIATAAIQFAARAYPAVVRDRNVVKGTVIGPDDGVPAVDPQTGQPAQGPNGQPMWQQPPGIKRQRADKIGEHMSWQLLDEQEEWEPQTDQLLIVLPIVGTMFRKSYFSPAEQRNMSETVDALRLVVNYKAKSFETAPRVTEIIQMYPWEIETAKRSGIFLDQDYGHDLDGDMGQDEDVPTTFLEQHRRYDLDGDGYAEPWIITVSRDSMRVARVRAGFEMEGIQWAPDTGDVMKVDPVPVYSQFIFIPSPASGVYGLGFGHLLFPINSAINSTLNQMFDAGHLQNAGGGFIGSQLSLNTGAVRFQVGEYKPVNTNGQTIRDSVFPIPFPGPSQVLFSLMQFLVEAGKEIAAVKDIMVGDMPGDNVSGITTLAVIEQGLKVFTAIYKRIHRALKSEYKKLFRLNRLYLPLASKYQVGDLWREISRTDYEQAGGVEPVSDPQMLTDMQRLGRAQFLGQFKDDPWFDSRLIRQKMLEAAQIPDAENLLKSQPPQDPAQIAQAAQLDLADRELKIRGAHWEAEMDQKRAEAKVRQVDLLAHAILNLANAAKADAASAQAWYAQEIARLQAQVESVNAESHQQPTENSPAAAAGLGAGGAGDPPAAGGSGLGAPVPGPGAGPGGPGGGAGGGPGIPVAGHPGGPVASGVPAMAAPPGQPTGAPLPG